MIFDCLSNYTGFRPAKLKESTGLVPNPGRGWYRIFYFHLPQQPDFQELRWCLGEHETLAMAVIHIGAYRDKPLDQLALETVSRIFDFFRQYGKDLILRFTYDCEGNSLLHEPSRFAQVEEHIRQLGPIIRSYTKSIFVLQGLFVGNWGEMHGSKFLSATCLKRLNALTEAAAGAHTWLAARRPCQWRILHGPGEKNVRMGLFDDGIFGSDSNLGTFGYLNRTQTQWENPWCPEDELLFETQLCMTVPQGGEAVCPKQSVRLPQEKVLSLLRQMRISYLNCVYDAKLLDRWKQMQSPWPGISLFDYVGAHLGYRFCIRKVRVRRKDRQLWLDVTVKNTGFAPCYEEYEIGLEIASADGVVFQTLPWELKTLIPDTVKTWSCAIGAGSGALYLSARRKKDGKHLRFAHDNQDEGRLYLGYLNG